MSQVKAMFPRFSDSRHRTRDRLPPQHSLLAGAVGSDEVTPKPLLLRLSTPSSSRRSSQAMFSNPFRALLPSTVNAPATPKSRGGCAAGFRRTPHHGEAGRSCVPHTHHHGCIPRSSHRGQPAAGLHAPHPHIPHPPHPSPGFQNFTGPTGAAILG